MNLKRAHITVSGFVQGVGFRYFASQKARALNLTGTVKNRMDGTVYIEVEGKKDDIEQLLVHLYQGPSMAKVDDVTTEWLEYTNSFQGFRTIG